MIRLTENREITPYKWVHPEENGKTGDFGATSIGLGA
jgi:hypothetical protein